MTKTGRRTSSRRKTGKSKPKAERRAKDRRAAQRRDAERVPLELWMEEMAGDDVYFRRTGNVAEGGVFFDRAIPHSVGTVVTLKFALPGDKEMVVARGKVVNAAHGKDRMGMGVKFITIEGSGQKRIRDYIRTI